MTATNSLGCTGTTALLLLVRESVDTLAGAGFAPTNPNRVRVYPAAGGAAVVDFFAYSTGKWGVRVASGDVDGGTDDEILTGPGPGDVFGPHVRGFFQDGSPIQKISFYAYGTLRYGVNVAAGRIDADLFEEILTGAGQGDVFGPHVRGWNFDAAKLAAIPKLSFFAYRTLKFGTNITSGDLEGDGFDELATGPGPGDVFGPQVRGWNFDAAKVTSIVKINFSAFSVPYYGAEVAAGDLEDDGYQELGAAPGPGGSSLYPARFRGFNFDGAKLTSLPGFDVVGFASATYGGRLCFGDLDQDGQEDLIGASGPDGAAATTVKAWSYNGSALVAFGTPFDAFPALSFGTNVATGHLGY